MAGDRRRDGGQRHLAAAAPRVRAPRARGLRDRCPRPLLALRGQRPRQDHGAPLGAEARRRSRRHRPEHRVAAARSARPRSASPGSAWAAVTPTWPRSPASSTPRCRSTAQASRSISVLAQCPLLAFFGGNDEWITRDRHRHRGGTPSRRRRSSTKTRSTVSCATDPRTTTNRRRPKPGNACSPSSPNTYGSNDGDTHTRQDRHPGLGAVPRRHDVRPVGQP